MSEFKIDMDVPMPAAVKFGTPERYPFSKLTPGASFFVPTEGPDARKKRKSMYSTANSAARRLGRHFVVRPVVEDYDGRKAVEGVRVYLPREDGKSPEKPKRGAGRKPPDAPHTAA